VGGGRAFALDGAEYRAAVNYGYRFDAATASPDGCFAVIYEKLGTKGLLLNDGQIVRELNRSFNHAGAYEYPVTLFNAPDGRLLLAHCPTDYCRLELEEAETGKPLTDIAARKPSDFFFSRLAASPSGTRLLSAGWHWHPWDEIVHIEVGAALANPLLLDNPDSVRRLFPDIYPPEESNACWLGDDCVAIAHSENLDNFEEEENSAETPPKPHVPPRSLAVYDLVSGTCLHIHQFDEPLGTIFAVGSGHILSLYRHPKLIEIATGKTLHVWRGLNTGLQTRSIMLGLEKESMPPPYAFSAVHNRFAISNGDTVTVIEFNVP
jgi:hypothetical protein